MSVFLGNAVVVTVLALILALAGRSVWRSRGHRCNGDCVRCKSCKK